MSKKQATIDILQRDVIRLHKELVDKVSEIEELKFIVKILTDQLTDCRAKLEAKEEGITEPKPTVESELEQIYSLVPNMPSVIGGQPLPSNLIASENDIWVTPKQPIAGSVPATENNENAANIIIENKQITQVTGNKRGSRTIKEVPVLDPDTMAIVNIQKWIRAHRAAVEYKKTVERFRRNCKLAAEEILKTERAYVRDLEVVIKTFKQQLEFDNINVASKEEIDSIFINITEIHRINAQLLNHLEDIFAKGVSVPSKIGVLFMRVMPYLKEYSLYVNRYRYSLSTLQDCRKRKDFEAWIQTLIPLPELQNLDLPDFLIKPVKRVPQYVLMLSQLIKYTVQDSQAFHTLTASLQKIKQIADWLNESKRHAETVEKINEIQVSLIEDPNAPILLEDGRVFVRESVLEEKLGLLTAENKRVYLFNDCILFAFMYSPAKFDKLLDLHQVKIDEGSPSGLSIGLQWAPNAKCQLVFESKEDKETWLNDLKRLQKEQIKIVASHYFNPIAEFITETPPSIVVNKAVKEGFLYKMSNRSKIWYKRWFVLEDGNLSSYRSKIIKDEPVKLLLKNFFLKNETKMTSRHRFCFELYNAKQKSLYFAAETETDRQEWMKALTPFTIFGHKLDLRNQILPLEKVEIVTSPRSVHESPRLTVSADITHVHEDEERNITIYGFSYDHADKPTLVPRPISVSMPATPVVRDKKNPKEEASEK